MKHATYAGVAAVVIGSGAFLGMALTSEPPEATITHPRTQELFDALGDWQEQLENDGSQPDPINGSIEDET